MGVDEGGLLKPPVTENCKPKSQFQVKLEQMQKDREDMRKEADVSEERMNKSQREVETQITSKMDLVVLQTLLRSNGRWRKRNSTRSTQIWPTYYTSCKHTQTNLQPGNGSGRWSQQQLDD